MLEGLRIIYLDNEVNNRTGVERKTVEQIFKGMRMLGGYRLITIILCFVICYDKNHSKD